MNIAYRRMSTGSQDGEGQRNTILEWSSKNGTKIDRWESEQVSSRKRRADRKVSKVIDGLQPGDKLIVSELSRLARSMTELMSIVQDVREHGAELVIVQDGMTLTAGDDWQASAYLMAVSMGAEIERSMISQRTKAGLMARKAQGVKLGRPAGRSKLDEHASNIRDLQAKGVTTANIARILGVSRSTLYAWMERN